jgi:crotonobetainyl-CoA:carnitine CoA-transferase CaiB-like acyl-CoA transferase
MLGCYRALDLTDERGQLAGAILASLGAEVIAVEPPGGSRSRHLGPFAGDEPGLERSLRHWAYNRGKHSVVVDPATSEGRAALADLVRSADVLLVTGPDGPFAAAGIDPAATESLNPALVHVTITPFGCTGPKAGWAASDLTVNAASGQLVLTGDADRAPLRISAPPQAFLQAAGDAAGAALVALAERNRSGRGQHVDVSAQTSMMASTQQYCVAGLIGAPPLRRAGGGVIAGDLHVQLVWACKDGHVSLTLLFGASLGPFARRLFEWMHEEGFCQAADRDKDWINLGMDLWSGRESPQEWERLKGLVAAFLETKTKAELLEASMSRKLLFAPLSTAAELVAFEQLQTRGYWDDVDHEGTTVRHPGRWCRFSATPPPTPGRPPRLGEHTDAVLASVATRRPSPEPKAAPPGSDDPARGALPLAGLNVLDFMWAVAGPSTTRTLADYGATVVKVESEQRTDGARTVGPFCNDDPGPDNTGLFHSMAANKLALALDLSRPEAREVVLDLVRWADVVTESFSPKAMKAWGLDCEQLRKVNPRLVMVSSCLMGQTGPMALYAGFGTMAAAICGFHHLTGWPDRAPVGPFSAYTDYVAPRFTLAALLAALDHRNRTGEGQHLDFSQLEASLHLLAPVLLDHTVNGRVAERQGNDDPVFAPHGVYACRGEDRWVAVACETDEQWRRLAGACGRADLAGLDAAERRDRRRELDEVVEGFTRRLEAADAEACLQGLGVPAHQVQNSPELAADPQLAHRQSLVEVPHPTRRTAWIENSRFRLDRTPAVMWRAGAPFGTDAYEVLHDLLGYDDDRIADIAAAELLQ